MEPREQHADPQVDRWVKSHGGKEIEGCCTDCRQQTASGVRPGVRAGPRDSCSNSHGLS